MRTTGRPKLTIRLEGAPMAGKTFVANKLIPLLLAEGRTVAYHCHGLVEHHGPGVDADVDIFETKA